MHKYRNLDGLRGLAALAVVMAHYLSCFYPAMSGIGPQIHTRFDLKIPGSPLYLLLAGNFAVCIFFVLSGFVLSAKFFRSKSFAALTGSAARRYIRLMLPALGSLVVIYLFLRLGLFKNGQTAALTGSSLLAAFWHAPISLGAMLKEGLYGIFRVSDPFGSNPPLWTIHYEFLGSFLLFMILALFGRLKNRWLFYLALALVFLKTYYLGFVLGIAICDVWHTGFDLKPILKWAGWPLLGIGLFLGAWIYIPGHPNIYDHFLRAGADPTVLSVFVHTVGAAFVILAALGLSKVKWLLETRPFQFLGRVSFSLYLLHFIVIGSYASYLFNHLRPNYSYNVSFLIMFVFAMTLTLVASWLYARYVDENAIRLAGLIGNKLTGDTALVKTAPLMRDVRSFLPARGRSHASAKGAFSFRKTDVF